MFKPCSWLETPVPRGGADVALTSFEDETARECACSDLASSRHTCALAARCTLCISLRGQADHDARGRERSVMRLAVGFCAAGACGLASLRLTRRMGRSAGLVLIRHVSRIS